VRTVRVRDLSAGLIEKAGYDGQTLAVAHDRELIGIVIPVTQSLVDFPIEQNMSRVLNTRCGDRGDAGHGPGARRRAGREHVDLSHVGLLTRYV
jgi:hypothetical protein